MRRTFAVAAAAVLGLLVSAGQAAASDPGGSAEQVAAGAAASAQSALALAGALQSDPKNANVAVRVLSPGDAGSVSQSNTVVAGSLAGNANSASQSANQTQAGSGTQTAGQIAGNEQAAAGSADATQLGATNENIDVRVLSPGDGGSVSQSNTVLAGSLAANENGTTQATNQSQAGGTGSGSQTSGQAATSAQDAIADADATQYGAKNRNINVRVLSPGNDGTVEQSNTVAGIAAALNGNSTTQSASQTSAGLPGGSGTQAALQGATSHQAAASTADATQKGASNENVGVRVLSPGDGGSVSQANTVLAGSLAKNGNATAQSASQSGAGGHGAGNQVVGQTAANHQAALADADALQYGATNTNVPVRIGESGDDGAVSQSNTALGLAAALNGNATTQTASQAGSGGAPPPVVLPALVPDRQPYPGKQPYHEQPGTGVQAIGQIAESTQSAGATSDATQVGPSNLNAPISIGGGGDGGSVSQSNSTLSGAIAANGNETAQTARQSQSGPGTLVQAIGQAALNKQAALACAKALQAGAANTNAPVQLFGKGDGGDVSQSNTAAALGLALNRNAATQSAGQAQAGGGGSPLVQALGQAAGNEQAAGGTGDAVQLGASNTSAPLHVGDRVERPCVDRKRLCEPKQPEPRPCETRKEPCEWKRPVVPPACVQEKPAYEPCEPCERLTRKCPERGWTPAA